MVQSIFELDFTEDDLAANRNGEVSEAQRTKLTAYARQQRQTVGWAIVITALLIAVGVGYEFIRTGGTLELFARRQSPFMLIILAVFFGLMVLATVITQIAGRGLKKPKVKTLEGKASVESVAVQGRGMRYTVHFVTVGGTRLRFYTDKSAAHFRDGARYRVYIVKALLQPAPIPLSAEKFR